MEKLYLSKTCLKMAGGEDASLLVPLLPARIIMSLTTIPTSRFGFSMICGKFCHSYVKITARTALVQFEHFTLKLKFGLKRGDFDPPNNLLGCATASNPLRLPASPVQSRSVKLFFHLELQCVGTQQNLTVRLAVTRWPK